MNKLYCSFSQMKGLLYTPWFDRILSGGEFLPPIGSAIDLTDNCNLGCEWCNSKAFRSENLLETTHVYAIIDLLSRWGVKSVCYAGGGEPTLHPDFAKIIRYTKDAGLQVGMSTNGTLLTREIRAAIIGNCSFCSISFDAGTRETWEKIKKKSLYDDLLESCLSLSRAARNTNLDLTFKFLISEDNQYEILEACKLAKLIGFKNFFMRPVAFENIPEQDKEESFDFDEITRQIEACRLLESETFKVYGNFGRVGKDFRYIHPYSKCLTTPLYAMFCADGYCYLCIDYRQRPYGRLCPHLEIKNFWGSPAHKKIINEIDVNRCPRCTFGHYNEQINHYKEDTFFRWFP